jgi:hypothetical protein
MNLKLSTALKTAMGYKEERVACCKDCQFYTEEQNQGGCWDGSCSFNNIGAVGVKPSGRCKKFKLRG